MFPIHKFHKYARPCDPQSANINETRTQKTVDMQKIFVINEVCFSLKTDRMVF